MKDFTVKNEDDEEMNFSAENMDDAADKYARWYNRHDHQLLDEDNIIVWIKLKKESEYVKRFSLSADVEINYCVEELEEIDRYRTQPYMNPFEKAK